MTIKEQTAYLQGMLSGMDLDETKNETKVLKEVVNVIQNLSVSFTDLDEDVSDILDQLQIVDEDLAAVENKVFENCDHCDCNDGCDCGDDCYEVTCGNCGEKVCLCEDMVINEKINCPNCGKFLKFDFEDCECNCGCGCEECGDDCGCEDGSCDCGCESEKDKK